MPDLSEADRVVKQARRDKAIVDKATEDLSEALRRLRLKDDDETHHVLAGVAALEGD